jgi:hypothetical protein
MGELLRPSMHIPLQIHNATCTPSLCLALSVVTRHYNKGLASRHLKMVGSLLRTNESNTCGSTCIQRPYSSLCNKVYGPHLRFLCSKACIMGELSRSSMQIPLQIHNATCTLHFALLYQY